MLFLVLIDLIASLDNLTNIETPEMYPCGVFFNPLRFANPTPVAPSLFNKLSKSFDNDMTFIILLKVVLYYLKKNS